MNDMEPERQKKDLVLEYELDAPLEKVWQAISIPAFRDKWLAKGELAEVEPVSSEPGEKMRYLMRDDQPPFLESIVTFHVTPIATGGTKLKIIHELADARLERRLPRAANTNRTCLMLAA
jgi:uncharacterized protein YndB with AHSA1/START domain